MKVRAVIFGNDRMNTIRIIKKKKISGNAFQVNGKTYFIDPNRMMVTWVRPVWKLWFRTYFATYYYSQDFSKPLPVPDFKALRTTIKNGKNVEEDYGGIYNNGISADELASIFNPWFYRTIAPTKISVFEQIHFFISVGTAIGVGYLIYLAAQAGAV